MDEVAKIALPALIALAGTALTAFIGYRQWKLSQDNSQRNKFQLDRQAAYTKLWDMLESIHVRLRTDQVGKREFEELVTEVNSFLLKNSLYIEKVDTVLASQYLDSVFRLNNLIAKSRTKPIQRVWAKTGPLDPDVLDKHIELRCAWEEVDKYRDKLVTNFRKVRGGKK